MQLQSVGPLTRDETDREDRTSALAPLDQARTIRLPLHLGGKINKLARVSDRLRDGLGHMPTEEAVALEMGLDASAVAELRQVPVEKTESELEHTPLTRFKVARRLGVSRETVRQLEREALAKLRLAGRAEKLRDYAA